MTLRRFRAPSFEGDVSSEDTLLEADTGATVLFDCQVFSLRDKTVSYFQNLFWYKFTLS